MTEPIDYLAQFADGVAQLLEDNGIAKWDAAADYQPGDVGTVIAAMPTAPSDIVSLTPYPISDSLHVNDSVIGLRVHLRGSADPRSVMQRNDQIFDVLEGLECVVVGGLYIVTMWRQSSLPFAQDANQRWEVATVFYARVNWPTRHRPD